MGHSRVRPDWPAVFPSNFAKSRSRPDRRPAERVRCRRRRLLRDGSDLVVAIAIDTAIASGPSSMTGPLGIGLTVLFMWLLIIEPILTILSFPGDARTFLLSPSLTAITRPSGRIEGGEVFRLSVAGGVLILRRGSPYSFRLASGGSPTATRGPLHVRVSPRRLRCRRRRVHLCDRITDNQFFRAKMSSVKAARSSVGPGTAASKDSARV